MDFVASVEDEFDILITMNMQAEIETVGQLVDAVEQAEERRRMTEARRQPDRSAPTSRARRLTARDLFSKFDALIAERQALLDTGVRDPFGLVMEKVLSPTRAIIQRQGDDPARHLQLYGHDLRSRRHRGRQEGARRIRLGHHRQPRAQRHLSGPYANARRR